MRPVTMKRICTAAAALLGLLIASSAAADGLVATAEQLPVKERVKLRQAIDAYRAANPQAFEAVSNIQGYRPEHYMKFRNPEPTVGRQLRRLGPAAALPMINALAFEAPLRSGATEREWRALKVGMLAALGLLRDPRSAPVLQAAFTNEQWSSAEAHTAAEALGRLGDDESLKLLLKALPGQKRAAAITGLGACRRIEAADALADLLDDTASADEAVAIAKALGTVGSSWAWKALGPSAEATGLAVRGSAAAALVRNFGRFPATSQGALEKALVMAEHPESRLLVEQHRSQLDGASWQRLQAVIAQIERHQR